METSKSTSQITWLVKDEKLKRSEMLNFEHSNHSLERACQRNITKQDITVAIEYGDTFFKQGLIFYVLGKNNLPQNIKRRSPKKNSNLVVVISGDSNIILTCYRSQNPFKHLKKKQKNRAKYFNAA